MQVVVVEVESKDKDKRRGWGVKPGRRHSRLHYSLSLLEKPFAAFSLSLFDSFSHYYGALHASRVDFGDGALVLLAPRRPGAPQLLQLNRRRRIGRRRDKDGRGGHPGPRQGSFFLSVT